jgi:hypothetical protein
MTVHVETIMLFCQLGTFMFAVLDRTYCIPLRLARKAVVS